jgi:hypothetical protein
MSQRSRKLPRLRIRKLISFYVELSTLNGESVNPAEGFDQTR